MKQLIIFLLICVSSFGLQAQELTAMTYNIRLDTDNDKDNRWEVRKDFLTKQIAFYEPMVFGIQEGLPNQVDYLNENLKNYNYLGVGRDDGKRGGEFSALFYDDTKLQLLEGGTFWLSETPEIPSKGWDAALNRVCTWGVFRIKKSKQKVLILNTHFDHVGQVARQKSLELIAKKAKELYKKEIPTIVMGDLNLEPTTEPIQWMSKEMVDTRVAAGTDAFGPEGTFNAWNIEKPVTRRIDYIFLSKNDFTLNKYAVLSDFVNLHYASDHLPVFVKLQFR